MFTIKASDNIVEVDVDATIEEVLEGLSTAILNMALSFTKGSLLDAGLMFLLLLEGRLPQIKKRYFAKFEGH